MDADAYLRRQGWRGTGHSLDHTDRGIKKPLLIAHKQDQLGLGKKKAAHSADDQWWMRAFDESLKNIGSGVESTLSQVRKTGINHGGLYGFFVKGEGMAGTIGSENASTETSTSQSSAAASRETTPPASSKDKKRKREGESTEDDRKRRKAEKKEKKALKEQKSQDRKDKKAAKKVAFAVPEVVVEVVVEDSAPAVVVEPLAVAVPDPAAEKRIAIVLTKINREVAKTIKKMDKGEQHTLISPAKKAEGMGAVKNELKKHMVVDAMLKGDLPNPKNYTQQQALDNYEKDLEDKRNGVVATPAAQTPVVPAQPETTTKIAEAQKTLSSAEQKEQKIIAAKILKLTVLEKTSYQERAKAKNQTLEQYILRRDQKKSEKSSKKAGAQAQ